SLSDPSAEIRAGFGRLGEQRHVSTVEQGQLPAADGLQAELLRSLSERHRAVQPVVVGEGERRVAELRRGERQLLGEGSAVEKREGGVAVELDIHKMRNAECGVRNAE